MKNVSKLLILLSIFLYSCSTSGVKLIPVKNDKEYQYIDTDGKIIINAQFSEASLFYEGLALVKSTPPASKWGYIDEEGKYVIQPKYKMATVFSEGIAWVVEENGAPVAINKEGKTLFTLQNADEVNNFHDGMAAFSIADSTGSKWGFVDKEGKIIIAPQFAAVMHFSEGLCAVANRKNKWGFINPKGELSINYQFDIAGIFENEKAAVGLNNKVGIIDADGKYKINPQFGRIYIDDEIFLVEQNGKWGWCDNEGKLIINPQFEIAFPFGNNDITPVKSGDNFGYVDKEGKMTINPQFSFAFPFNGDNAIVSNGSQVGIIDEEGKYLVNPQFENVSKDVMHYFSNKISAFQTAETDYFDVSVIANYISKEITSDSFWGITFSMPLNKIMEKFKISASDWNSYSSSFKIMDDISISKDAEGDLSLIGKPLRYISDGWYGVRSVIDDEYLPQHYLFRINLKGNGVGKEQNLISAISKSIKGYTEQVKENESIILENKNHIIRINENGGVEIHIIPKLVPPQNKSETSNTLQETE
ncbi:MAG: WG repeat-containing protein [Bacteroidia bacterium]|jgi:hypothetical protein|nr:WG repeat-containing protein [Bacteroidia bacterium]